MVDDLDLDQRLAQARLRVAANRAWVLATVRESVRERKQAAEVKARAGRQARAALLAKREPLPGSAERTRPSAVRRS